MHFYSLVRSICLPAACLVFVLVGAPSSANAQTLRADDTALKERLAEDSFFKNHRWQRAPLGSGTSEASFIVLWDAMDSAVDEETNPKLLGRLGGWLRAQSMTLQNAEYLPEAFKSRLEKQVVPILILRSQTEYERWQIEHASVEYRSAAATYDPKLGALVCHLEKRGIGESAHDLRNFILHMHARQLLSQAAPSLADSGSQWLLVGLSELVSTAAQTTAKESIPPYIYRQGLRNVLKVLNDYKDRERYWIHTKALFEIQGAKKRLSMPIDMKVAGKSRKTLWGLIYYFDQQSMLWMHFLLSTEEGQQALARCVKNGLKGPMSTEATLEHLGYEHAQAAETAIHDWLKEIAKPVGGLALKANTREKRLANGAARSKGNAAGASAKPKTPPPPPKPTMQPLSADQIMALTLTQVRRGDWTKGLSILEHVANSTPDPRLTEGDRERMTKETVRLRATLKARDKFLEATVANGKRLRFLQDGKGVMIKPTAWKDGVLTLEPTRKCPLQHLDSNQMNPEFLALNWKKLSPEMGPDWLYGYVCYLAGDSRWRRALRDTKRNPSAELQALGDWTATGELIDFLNEYEEGKPKGLSDEKLAGLCNTFFMDMELSASGDYFRLAVRQEVQQSAKAMQAHEFLAVTPEPLADGAIRLTYNFDDERELEDFKEMPTLWEESRRFPDEPVPESQDPPAFEGGAIEFSGERRFGHSLQWTGPIHIRYRYELVSDDVADPTFYLWFGVRVKPKGAWLRSEFHTLVAFKGPRKRMLREKGEGVNTAFDEIFEGTLSWDGRKAYMTLNGKPAQELMFGGEGPGAVVFWSESEFPIKIYDLTIEGTVDPVSLALARGRWTSERMRSLGFREK